MTGRPGARGSVVVSLPAEIDLANREQAYDQLYAAFVSGSGPRVTTTRGLRRANSASSQGQHTDRCHWSGRW